MHKKLIVVSLLSFIGLFQNEAMGDWSGGYLGLHGAAGWGYSGAALVPFPSNSPYLLGVDIASIKAHGDFTLSDSFYAGGVQAGYNVSLGQRVVLGLETDLGVFGFQGTGDISVAYPNQTPALRYHIFQEVRTNWLYTLRPRIGYALDRALAFVTGGLGVTRLTYQERFDDDFFAIAFQQEKRASQRLSVDKTVPGWVVGAGFECMVREHLSFEFTYLYAQFNKVTASNQLHVFYSNLNTHNPMVGQAELHASLFRAALNFRL